MRIIEESIYWKKSIDGWNGDKIQLLQRITDFYQWKEQDIVPRMMFSVDKPSWRNDRARIFPPYQKNQVRHCHCDFFPNGDPLIAYRTLPNGHILLICVTNHYQMFSKRDNFVKSHPDALTEKEKDKHLLPMINNIMNMIERPLLEYTDPNIKLWMSPDFKSIVPVSGSLHSDIIERDPSKFGLKPNPDPMVLTRQAMKAGWIRIGMNPQDHGTAYIESYNEEGAKQAAKWLEESGVENICIEVKGSGHRPIMIRDDQIKHFVKSGFNGLG